MYKYGNISVDTGILLIIFITQSPNKIPYSNFIEMFSVNNTTMKDLTTESKIHIFINKRHNTKIPFSALFISSFPLSFQGNEIVI